MKQLKFIAAAAVLASTSLVSGEASITTTTELAPNIARACPEWPYCRDVELAEQLTDTAQPLQQAIVRKAV